MKRKEKFRQQCKLRLKSTTSKYKSNLEVLRSLSKILRGVESKNILLYLPLVHECDLLKIFPTLELKNSIFVPFMEGVSFKAVKFRRPLFKKKFSILEPNNSQNSCSKIDIAIVPVIGVDGVLGRVGHGKGMYDRFFTTLKTKPKVIFVQLDECYTKDIITDTYDIKAHIYLTPKNIKIKRGKNDTRVINSRGSRGVYWSRRILGCKEDK